MARKEPCAKPVGDKKLCGAKNRSGGTCKLPPIAGRTRCKFHGGKSLRGPAHPRWDTGKRSKYRVPEHLQEAFARASENPHLLEMTEELILIDTRIHSVLDGMDSGQSRDAWYRARESVTNLKAAFQANDGAAIRTAVSDLFMVIDQGIASERAWDELFEAIQHRRAIVETERRRIEAMSAYMTAETAMALVIRLVNTIRKYLEPKQYSEFSQEIGGMTGLNEIHVVDVTEVSDG